MVRGHRWVKRFNGVGGRDIEHGPGGRKPHHELRRMTSNDQRMPGRTLELLHSSFNHSSLLVYVSVTILQASHAGDDREERQ